VIISSVTSGAASNIGASVQEAMETIAQTKAEAAKGDPQAIQKLARMCAAQNPQSAGPPPAATGGRSRTLDARA